VNLQADMESIRVQSDVVVNKKKLKISGFVIRIALRARP